MVESAEDPIHRGQNQYPTYIGSTKNPQYFCEKYLQERMVT